LADDWTVTYVAHPSILRKRTSGERETAPKLPVSALALGYQDGQPHGQAPLGMATAEATEIARLFDGRLYLEAEATETNLLAALDQSKRVHVACHGKALASAPAFQSLYLQPDGTDDGLFHAYEIAGRDLRHVDLVTLSACETALGRFDALDNLRGFSANLFLAGVRTVVSTLWPVPDDVSHLFFTSMYRALHAGNGKVAAFEAALRATRSEFPKYRDWGTFHFGGLW
jgi:CHAT domain-containing protein